MELILGSAQFADSYGISNNKSFISKKDLKKIFSISKKKKFIDTAYTYKGSLETIKQYNYKYKFKINLKIDIGSNKDYQKKFFERINYCFYTLDVKKIYCIMIHDTKNFIKLSKNEKNKILNKLRYLKKIGKIKKIGFSIYDKEEIIFLKRVQNINIVQIPLNIFDQSLLYNKDLLLLKNRDIEIHARSIFLQGLVFVKFSKIEKIVGKKINKIKLFYKKFPTIEERLYHCINFIKNCEILDKTIIGFTDYKEFKKLNDIFNKKKIITDYKPYAIMDKKILRPYLWKITNTSFK